MLVKRSDKVTQHIERKEVKRSAKKKMAAENANRALKGKAPATKRSYTRVSDLKPPMFDAAEPNPSRRNIGMHLFLEAKIVSLSCLLNLDLLASRTAREVYPEECELAPSSGGSSPLV